MNGYTVILKKTTKDKESEERIYIPFEDFNENKNKVLDFLAKRFKE